MKAWEIIRHACLQITGNFAGVLRISIVLFALQSIVKFMVRSHTSEMATMQQENLGSTSLLVFAVYIFTSLWIAVAWHRYILIGEISNSYLPNLKLSRLSNYFWRGSLLALIAAGSAIFLIIFAKFVVTSMGGEIYDLVILLLFFPGFYFACRISPILPAAAIDRSITIKQAWRSTRNSTSVFVTLFIVMIIFIIIGYALYEHNLSDPSFLSITGEIVVGWLGFIFGISTLTSIYGHYTEGRNLN